MIETRSLKDMNLEQDMIWLEDPAKYEYVRESSILLMHPNSKPLNSRNNKFVYRDGINPPVRTRSRLIGYERYHGKHNEPCSIKYYWLKPYDRGMPYAGLRYGKPGYEMIFPTEAIKIVD